MRMSLLVAASAFALLAGCSPEPAKPAAVVETPKAAIGTFGIDLTAMDKAVKPGDDFYKFASGAWDAKTTIPSDRTRYGNFDKLSELSEARTRAIIEAAAANTAATGDTAKVGAAYRAFMDEAAIEATKAPLMEHLIELRSRLIKSVAAFAGLFIIFFYFAKDIYNLLVVPFERVAGPGDAGLLVDVGRRRSPAIGQHVGGRESAAANLATGVPTENLDVPLVVEALEEANVTLVGVIAALQDNDVARLRRGVPARHRIARHVQWR